MLIKNSKEQLLSEILIENGINIDKPCGGNGTCGKCKVKVRGNLSEISNSEKTFLSSKELKEGIRLACKTIAFGDVEFDFCGEEDDEKTQQAIPEKCVAAVDLGTTVIEAQFYSKDGNRLIKHEKINNPLGKFGADIISRIMFSVEENGKEKIKEELHLAIKQLSGILYDYTERFAIVGNTAMLHFYSGLDTSKMASYPFEPESYFGIWEKNTFMPRCISAYCGADITTAILASGMLEEVPSLLVDIGTNGEMALFDGKKLYVTSTAAGPALEGASISCGMMAKSGAIKRVLNDGSYETVDGTAPKGICASGLIDAICFMLKKGIMTKDGYLEKDYEIKNSGVFISPKDVRNFQLAKASIKAGIETLLEKRGIKACELKKVYIAGALGSNTDTDNAMKAGLIPELKKNKIILLGNAALKGASMILTDENNILKTDEIARNAEYIELSLTEEFTKRYIDNISF